MPVLPQLTTTTTISGSLVAVLQTHCASQKYIIMVIIPVVGKGSLLIMEYLNLAGRSDDRTLGRAVARMHLAPANEETGNPNKAFGFSVDNTM